MLAARAHAVGQSIPTEPGRRSGPTVTAPAPSAAGAATTAAPPYELAWRRDGIATSVAPELIVIGDAIVTAGLGQPVVVRRASDGETLWTLAVELRQLAAAGGRLVGLAADAVVAIDLATGTEAWRVGTPPEAALLSATAGSAVLVGADVRALDLATGTERWRAQLPTPAQAVSADDALVALILTDRSVLALETATGAVRWQTTLDDQPRWLAVAGPQVLVGPPRLGACALSAAQGRFDWCTTQIPVPAVGPPLVEDRRLFFALFDGSLATLDRGSGTLVGNDRLPGRPAAPPARLGANLVVALTTNVFIVVPPTGRPASVTLPNGSQALKQAAISSAAGVLVSLSVTMKEDMTLVAYRPTPPAPPPPPTPAPPPAPPVPPADGPLAPSAAGAITPPATAVP